MCYAIQTRVRREQLTATLSAKRGYEIFLLTCVPERSRPGEYREVISMFPGFLFGQFDGSFLECGQRVRITEHALEGSEGISVGHKGLHRIVVPVTLLRRPVALETHSTSAVPKQPEYEVSDERIAEGVSDDVTA
jgi:hypothetical protein